MEKIAGIFVIILGFAGNSALRAQYDESQWDSRDSWMDVRQIFEWAGVETGDTVADIGCHEGYLSVHLAREVGRTGYVYAVDIVEHHLEALETHAAERDLKNIRTVLGAHDNPRLPEKSCDVVFVMDSYHEMDDYMTMLGHLKGALKPDGRLVILEKLKDHARNKSRDEQAGAHTLSPRFVKKELEEAGFDISREYRDLGFWENEEDKVMWLLVATVSGA